jgi:predicted nucleic acid-binding protein
VLPALYEPVASPPEVHREFAISLPWLKVESPSDKTLVAALGLLVDEGEAEAIALACERQTVRACGLAQASLGQPGIERFSS